MFCIGSRQGPFNWTTGIDWLKVDKKAMTGSSKPVHWHKTTLEQMGRVKRIWFLSHMRTAKVQASLRIRTVSPEPPLLAHTNSESRGTFRQKARSVAPLNGWACAVKIFHDGTLEDTNSLDAAQNIVMEKTLKSRLGSN